MTKWIVRLLILAAVVLGAFFLWKGLFAPRPIAVRVMAAGMGRVEATVTNSKAGTVKARQRARLSPELGGRVVEITRREGDRVRKGEVLVRLDDATLRAQLALAERSLEAAEASHQQSCIAADRARSELDRNRKLVENSVISEDLLDQLQHNFDAATASCAATEAQVARSLAAVDVARVELEKAVLKAPFDGVLAEVSLELGEWVTPSPPMLPVPSVIDIIDPSSIYISAPMDEVDSAVIKVGQVVRVTLDPFPDREFEGRVVRVAPYVLDIEAQNRTVEIEVELVDRDFAKSLLPGTSADVEVLLAVEEEVIRIPSSSIVQGEKVFVVEGDVLRDRRVEVGLKNWEYAQVLSGLDEGDLVVTSLDRVGLEPGALVTIENPGELDAAAESPDEALGTRPVAAPSSGGDWP